MTAVNIAGCAYSIAAEQGDLSEAETKQKKDCVIVAAEAYKRLQAQGIWAEVVTFTWNCPESELGSFNK